ncbi:MAG: HD domain-containing protein [Candidatus Asgardarchaeia archaeon]
MAKEKKKEKKEIFDWSFTKCPVFGYITINTLEKDLIDTYPVQRLRRLRQLAGSEYVYPGANHTRFEHSLGVMFLAGIYAESLGLDTDKRQIARIAGLLHDVGHGPFSHIFEHILINRLNKTHEDITTWIIEKTEIADVLRDYGYNPRSIAKRAIGKLEKHDELYMDQIIRSSIDADKMDFIIRDNYHTGAGYGDVDIFRIIYTSKIYKGNIVVNLTALSALEVFLISRMQSFRNIYFHKVSRSAQIMLSKAIDLAADDLGLADFKSPEEYLQWDDYILWTKLLENEKSSPIIKDLQRRNMLKVAYELVMYQPSGYLSRLFTNAQIREQLSHEIAESAGIPEEDVAIDVPSLPSVPYQHSITLKPMDIPIYKEEHGKILLYSIDEVSEIIKLIKGFMNIIRVYTKKEYRERVKKAAEKILGELPYSAKISY